MTRAKWIHKWRHTERYGVWGVWCGCGAFDAVSDKWKETTCPKCLAKKPKSKAKDYMSFELDGKIYVTERKADGTLISQEEIDGEVVLKLLVSVLEEALNKQIDLDKICEYNCKIKNCECKNKYCLNCAGLGFTYYTTGKQSECLRCKGTGYEKT